MRGFIALLGEPLPWHTAAGAQAGASGAQLQDLAPDCAQEADPTQEETSAHKEDSSQFRLSRSL